MLWEKSGEQVAHFKATLLLLPSGPDKVTGHPSFPAHVSDKALDDPALLALLAQPVKVDKKAAKKAAKAAAAAAGGEGGDAGDAAAAAQQPPAPPAQ